MFEAKKRYGLCVLNYVVTSNHIHLLVKDTASHTIAKSMQLISGRTAQAFNNRKNRHGAFWEDRYHATIIENDQHLFQCLAYIDMNMVRAGVVVHPSQWRHGGYQEIQLPPERYGILDISELIRLTGVAHIEGLQVQHRGWIDEAMQKNKKRDSIWTESLAVGSQKFVSTVQSELGASASKRTCAVDEGRFHLREESVAYSIDFSIEKSGLS